MGVFLTIACLHFSLCPCAVGRHPAVLDMFGSGGGLMDFRAALLASKGFVVLSLAYFAYDDLPKVLEVDMEYFDVSTNFTSRT